jgi:transposase-like protein
MTRPSDAQLLKLHKSHGGNVSRVAKELGRPAPTVTHWYRSLGLAGTGRGGQKSTAPAQSKLEALWAAHAGNVSQIADALGENPGTVANWYRKLGLRGQGRDVALGSIYRREVPLKISDGRIIAFSDAHYWDTTPSPAHRALLSVIKTAKPLAVIANGDIIDGASISRHDPSGLETLPTIDEELHACRVHMSDISRAAGPKCRLLYNLGNHCLRPFSYIARSAPEFRGVVSAAVAAHFPGWSFGWSVRVNNELLIMHRLKGGQHATYGNVLKAGMSTATGHLHSQRCYPFTDATGTKWGVDLGCLAAPGGPQFGYTEAAPLDWRAGFVVFEFRGGKLQPPELVTVLDDGSVVWQRNQRVE